jgi:hypothetical protein
MNIFPRKAESINGSDYISNYPEFSKTLKQCAALRKQFLPYFTEGNLVGDCILSDTCPAHVTAYVLKDKALMFLINQWGHQSLGFDCDLQPWLKSTSGKYGVNVYNADGKLIRSVDSVDAKWHGDTGPIKAEDLIIFEFTAK